MATSVKDTADDVDTVNYKTLNRFVMANTADQELTILMSAIAMACKATARACRKAGIGMAPCLVPALALRPYLTVSALQPTFSALQVSRTCLGTTRRSSTCCPTTSSSTHSSTATRVP